MSVIVPTVECEPPPSRFWSTTMAAERFSIVSTSGCPYRGRKFRANAVNVSLSCRCASAAMVSKTMDDLPDPETPVKATNWRFGTRSETFRRLFSLAPVMTISSAATRPPIFRMVYDNEHRTPYGCLA